MILITDNFLKEEAIEEVRQSAIDSGFGTWQPPTAKIGSGKYEGMSFHAKHAIIHGAISQILGRPIIPNISFVRMLTEDSEKRYIHSDRESGDYTAITYLSSHDEVSGTAFYQHKPTGKLEMPPVSEIDQSLIDDMVSGDDGKWSQTDFVRGIFGRILIFSAPLFHGRFPINGIGSTPEDARTIAVCHFY